MILIVLALLLLVCSISLFFKHWKKNYRDINQLPYYAYLYQKDPDELLVPPVGVVPPPVVPVTPAGSGLAAMELWKTHANNLNHNLHGRSMHSLFKSTSNLR